MTLSIELLPAPFGPRADDGAHLVLEHVERHVGERLDATEPERDRVELEDRPPDGESPL
jgi:hypothetical protein